MTDHPLNRQVGGDHYRNLTVQPVEFAMKNRWDFCAASALKYICRHRQKGGKQDLLKAKHFLEIRKTYATLPLTPKMSDARHDKFSDQFHVRDRNAILCLMDYVYWGDNRSHALTVAAIDDLIDEYDRPADQPTLDL